jgi:hypothetical protein
MPRGTVGPVVICDGCAFPTDLEMAADNTDTSKGLLVDEQWQGKCPKCHYEFSLRIVMKGEVNDKSSSGK